MSANGVIAQDATLAADTFTALMAQGDAKAVANFFQGMTEKDRRTFVKPLREFLKSVGWRALEGQEWREFAKRRSNADHTLTPAALAVFANAGATAKFLRSAQRSDLFDARETEAIKQILADRAPAWLADLPTVLLETLEPERAYRLVEVAREVAGVEVAATREFLRAWAEEHRWSNDHEKLKTVILDDPRLAELVPLIFDDDENDALFTSWAPFRVAVATAVQQGRVPRADVLDASLRRLLRGGRTGAMQDHVALWNGLEATDAEVAERVSSCISLLSSQSGTVARTFLAALKKASDAGLLDVELAVEATSIAVTRSEKNVVKTTLGWLDALAAAHPDRAGQIVGTMAIAFGAQAADLQERAVTLVGKRAKTLGEDERGRLVAEGQIYLAPDLAAKLAGLLKISPSSDSPDSPDALAGGLGYPEIAPYVPRPLLPPIASPAELAEVIASLIHGDPVEAMVFERVLEALVVFARTDAAALKDALAPVVERWHPGWEGDFSRTTQTPRNIVCMLAATAAGIGESSRRHPHRAGVKQLWKRVRTSDRSWWRRTRTTPADFLILRGAEVRAAWGMPDLPPLVSVPTSPTGLIEPTVLAARLRECDALGLVPLEADFHQALLRLPEDCGNVDVSGLTSKTGRRFAAWVRGDRAELPAAVMPDPVVWHEEHRDRGAFMRQATRHHIKDPETLLDLARGVWNEPERCWDQSDWAVCWPAIVPSRPDLAAMALLGGADWTTAPASVESAVVLAEQDGPQGATHQVIAARLVADDVRLRASGVDAALVLAARGLLDPAELSAALARQLAAVPAGLRRALPSLRDAANAGAAQQIWETIALLLPSILPPAVPKAVSGTADVLVLATELAGVLGARGPIAEVSAIAGKKGGGAVGNAARRLAGVIGME